MNTEPEVIEVHGSDDFSFQLGDFVNQRFIFQSVPAEIAESPDLVVRIIQKKNGHLEEEQPQEWGLTITTGLLAIVTSHGARSSK